MQKDDSALNVLPRCTGGSFNREFVNSKDGGARSLGENECVGSFRVSTSLPNTSPRLSSFASFFYFLSRCRQKIGAKRNDLATADLKKGLLDWLPSSPVVVNEPGQGSTENLNSPQAENCTVGMGCSKLHCSVIRLNSRKQDKVAQ